MDGNPNGAAKIGTAELCDWLAVDRATLSRLARDGVLPKCRRNLWPLKECVSAYVRYMASFCRKAGYGNLRDEDGAVDPDKLPVDERVKYWQAVRLRQTSLDHLAELAEAAAGEYANQAAESFGIIQAAIEAAGLTPEQLATIRDAIARADNG